MENVVILTSSDSDSDYSDTSSEEKDIEDIEDNENKIETLLNHNSEYEINKDNIDNISGIFYNNSTYYNSLQRKISLI